MKWRTVAAEMVPIATGRTLKNIIGSVFIVCFVAACLPSAEVDMKRARSLSTQKKPSEAAALFEKIAAKNGGTATGALAALEAAKIYQYDLKKPSDAIRNYRLVILHSKDPATRRDSQIKLAGLLFYDSQEFAEAINEYSKLLNLQHTLPEEIEWRSRIARAYYYQGNYFQSGIEVDKLLKLAVGVDEEAVYQAYLLKANIYVGAREHEQAAKVLDSMMSQFAERARRDSIPLMLAVAYEEQRSFDKAIEVLRKVREYDSRKSFFDEKIRSLQERQAQAPGARGFRK